MTCETVQAQLLERGVDDLGDLSAHLNHCERCSALADTITQGEKAMYEQLNAYLNASDFDARWEEATAPSRRWIPPSAIRWMSAAAIALATVGALTLAARSGPEESPAAPPPIQEDAELDVIEVAQGRSAFVEFGPELASIRAIDPDVLRLQSMPSGQQYQVQARAEGFSALVADMRDGSKEVFRFEVVDRNPRTSPHPKVRTHPDETRAIRKGDVAFIELESQPKMLATTDPGTIRPDMSDRRTIALSALDVGLTDLVVIDAQDELHVIHIEVVD